MDKAVVFVVTNLDDDDMTAVVSHITYADSVLLVCDAFSAGGCDLSRYHSIVFDSPSDPTLCTKIHAWGAAHGKKMSGIIGLDEEHHYRITERLARELGLEFYERRILDIASNKYLQRKIIGDAGVRVPRYQLMESADDKPRIGFPNVLKLITGYASQFIFRNKTPQELEKNMGAMIDAAKATDDSIFDRHDSFEAGFDPRKTFILEEYVGGDEYSCDFFIQEGEVTIIRVVKKIMEDFALFKGFYLFNPDKGDHDFTLDELRSFCKKIAGAVGIRNGFCMADFKSWNKELVLIETSIRPGISIFIELMANVYGRTTPDMIIRHKLGLSIDTDIPDKTGLVFNVFAYSRGKLKEFDTTYLEKNSKKLGIIDIIKYGVSDLRYHPDDDPRPTYLGYIMIKDVQNHKIKKTMENLISHIYITIEDKNAGN